MRPAVLRRAAGSNAARAACPFRKPSSRCSAGNASLPGRPLSHHSVVVCAFVLLVLLRLRPSLTCCCRARLCDLAAHLATSRCKRVSLWSCAVPRCGPRCCAALGRPKLPASRALFANRFPDSPPATPRCPAGRSGPKSLLASITLGVTGRSCARRCDRVVRLATLRCSSVSLRSCGVQKCDPRCCAAPRRPKFPRCLIDSQQSRSPDPSPSTPPCPADRSRPTSLLRPARGCHGLLLCATL